MLQEVCYEVGVQDLIDQGYLSPLTTKVARREADTRGLHVRAGEFIQGETEALMNESVIVQTACREIVEFTTDRKSTLVFCGGVDHGRHVTTILRNLGCDAEAVFGNTSSAERADILERFKSGDLKYLANCNVLTTGFDATNIDAMAILRPTMSPGFWYQMVGRGFRIHPGKTDCLVLDFGGNALRHGPITHIRPPNNQSTTGKRKGEAPAKMCPQCRRILATVVRVCECVYEFPRREVRHAAHANAEYTELAHRVKAVTYANHVKRAGDRQLA